MEKQDKSEQITNFVRAGKKYLLLLCGLGFFVMIIWGILLYDMAESNMENMLEREVQRNEQYLLNYNELLKNIGKDIYNDPVISKILIYKEYSIGDYMLAKNRIDNYRLNSSVLQSVYIYAQNKSSFYVSADSSYNENAIQTMENFQDQDFQKRLKTGTIEIEVPCVRTIQVDHGRKEFPVCTYLFSDVIGKDYLDGNLIAVNANQEMLFSGLNYDEKNGQISVVLDQAGRLLYATGRDNIAQQDVDQLTDKWDPKEKNLERRIQIQGKLYSAYGVYIESMQWWQICFVPRNVVFRQFGAFILLLTFLLAILLIGGLFFAGNLERKRQIPIFDMFDKMETLQIEKEENNEKIVNKVLFDMLMGWKEYRLKELQESFAKYQIELEAEADCYLIIVKMDRYSEYCIKYKKKGQALLMHIIMENFERELQHTFSKIKATEMSYDMIAVICQEDAEIVSYDMIEVQIKRIKELLKNYNVTVSVMVSAPFETMRNIAYVYEKTKESMNAARLFKGYDMTESVQRMNVEPYVPGRNLSSKLMDCLMRGDFVGARKEYEVYIRRLEHFEGSYVQRELSNFSMVVMSNVDKIMKNNHLSNQYVQKEIILYNSDVETIEVLTSRFYTLLDQVEEELVKKKSGKHADLVNQIVGIVEENYMDENLSIQEIAEQLKISYSQARNIFKTQMQISLSDYILQYRLDRVKEMLVTTTDSVKVIEEKCGFSNYAYFYRVFKKFVGATPLDYRMYHTEEKDVEK